MVDSVAGATVVSVVVLVFETVEDTTTMPLLLLLLVVALSWTGGCQSGNALALMAVPLSPPSCN